MKRVCAFTLSVALALPALPIAQAQAADDIIIGYAAAITGMYAPYDSVDGAKCEIDRLNEAGGVLGRKFRLEARDMKSDAVVSATAGQELIDLGATAILSPPSDDTSIPIAALAAPLGIPCSRLPRPRCSSRPRRRRTPIWCPMATTSRPVPPRNTRSSKATRPPC